jgi:hypothetical protein
MSHKNPPETMTRLRRHFVQFSIEGRLHSVPRHTDGAEAAVAEVVGHGVVGSGADVGQDVGTVRTVVVAHAHRGGGGVGVLVFVEGAGAAAVAAQGTGAGAVMGLHVGAVAAEVAAHPLRLGGGGGEQEGGEEGEFGEGIHGF